MTVLAKYCRAIVDGTKKAEGRPCNRKYAKVQKGNYLNLGVAWNWIIVVVVSRNVQPTCEKMVEVCGWDDLVPESGSNYSCTQVYKKMYPKWEGKWVFFQVQVLEYKIYKGVQTAVCGGCQDKFDSATVRLSERVASPERVFCATCSQQST